MLKPSNLQDKMILEKLVKQGKALVAGLAFASAASGCIYIDARKSDSVPAYPKTEVQANFGDGLSGKVNYEVCGEIPFNQINYTLNGVPSAVSFNDAEMVDNENSRCFYRESDIIDGENSVTAVADENPNSAENGSYKFTPATEGEARAKIGEVLNARNSEHTGYLIDNIYSAPQDGINTIMVDYNVETFNPQPEHDAIIEYVNHQQDLNQELNDKQYLDNYDVPNRYFFRLPLSEVESRLNDFIDSW